MKCFLLLEDHFILGDKLQKTRSTTARAIIVLRRLCPTQDLICKQVLINLNFSGFPANNFIYSICSYSVLRYSVFNNLKTIIFFLWFFVLHKSERSALFTALDFLCEKTFCLWFLFNRYQYVYVLNFEQTQYMEKLFTGTVLNEMHCSTDLHCFKVLIF